MIIEFELSRMENFLRRLADDDWREPEVRHKNGRTYIVGGWGRTSPAASKVMELDASLFPIPLQLGPAFLPEECEGTILRVSTLLKQGARHKIVEIDQDLL